MKPTVALATTFWVLTAVLLLLDAFLPPTIVATPGYYVGTMVVFVLSIFAWFLADATEIGFRPSVGLKIAVLALPVIAVPYYRFRYTGLKRGAVFLAKTFGLLIVVLGVVFAISMVIDRALTV